MKELDERMQYTLRHRLSLFGAAELTWEEIGIHFDVSRERARQIYLRAIRLLRVKYFHRIYPHHPIITEASGFPDLLEILGRREN